MPFVLAAECTLSQSVSALVAQALATNINLGKLAVLVKVLGCTLDRYSGDQLPAVDNDGYSPREWALTITNGTIIINEKGFLCWNTCNSNL